MKKNSLLGLWVLLCSSTLAFASPERPTESSPWRLFLGADGGYAQYHSLNSSTEGDLTGFSAGGRALIAFYTDSLVLDGGAGWEFLSVKGNNPNQTVNSVSTKMPYLDFSIRYRLGRYLQLGPEFEYSLGTDYALDSDTIRGPTNNGVYIGAQVVHEWEHERKFRLGARWLTPISGTPRNVNQFQAFFQIGFDAFGSSEPGNPRRFDEQISERDLERAESFRPKSPLPMSTPVPSRDSTPVELEQVPLATPAPPSESEVLPVATPTVPDAPPAFEDAAKGTRERASTRLVLTLGINDLPFGFTDAKLPKAHQTRIKAIGAYLKEHAKAFKKLMIAGHTDERGSKAKNLNLSRQRAEVVRNLLVAGGAPSSKIVSEGFGETQPLDPRHLESAWAKNRRVELRFSGVSDASVVKKALDQ